MREIKFRAWDKNSEQMITEGGFIELNGNGAFKVFIETSGEWEENGKNGGDIILMQYIGLKDTDKKKIFEGDILVDGDDVVGIVEYSINDGCFLLVDEYGIIAEHRYATEVFMWQKFTIIGNICEPPEELLNQYGEYFYKSEY